MLSLGQKDSEMSELSHVTIWLMPMVDAMRMRGNTCAKQVPICTVSLQFVISSVPYLSV